MNVAKWLAADSKILIIDEPTIGVDVGAKEYFTRLIWDLAKKKKSIILISSDMPEVIKLANRILIFSGNRIVGQIETAAKTTKRSAPKSAIAYPNFRCAVFENHGEKSFYRDPDQYVTGEALS